ncbi:hypothetical protein LQ327_02250 [Actinomycetospora endophytica]|uniref:Polyketide cyclase/dehydrase/lipid transport protein n=1 Tax=Actinomycetospora endophytica TaxID=2291215 RepID=A0ABS8P1U4_9PSEU|nr:hypothetical protein [Actinomycetospora endophytica]MCD2192216.1 hypothetical protein [Actinomycetospora endophytica]
MTIARTSCLTSSPGEPADALPAADADALAGSLDDAAGHRAHAPLAWCAALAVVVGTALVAGIAPAVVVALLALPTLAVVGQIDRARRTVVATYLRPGSTPSSRHERLVGVWERHRMTATSWEPAVWEVAPHGGHQAVARRVDGPRHLRADLAVPTFAAARRDVAFLPDRVVVREGRAHRVAGYDELEVSATVCERAGGGRLGRLTLRVAGATVVYDLTSIAATQDLAAALRGMTGTRAQRTTAADRATGSLPVPSPRDGGADGAWDVVGPAAAREPRQSDVTGSPWASPTVAL